MRFKVYYNPGEENCCFFEREIEASSMRDLQIALNAKQFDLSDGSDDTFLFLIDGIEADIAFFGEQHREFITRHQNRGWVAAVIIS